MLNDKVRILFNTPIFKRLGKMGHTIKNNKKNKIYQHYAKQNTAQSSQHCKCVYEHLNTLKMCKLSTTLNQTQANMGREIRQKNHQLSKEDKPQTQSTNTQYKHKVQTKNTNPKYKHKAK